MRWTGATRVSRPRPDAAARRERRGCGTTRMAIDVPEHRELPRHTGAFGRQAHRRLTLLVGELLDEAGRLDLLRDGVELSRVVTTDRAR